MCPAGDVARTQLSLDWARRSEVWDNTFMEERTVQSRSLVVPSSAKAGKDEADKCVWGGGEL